MRDLQSCLALQSAVRSEERAEERQLFNNIAYDGNTVVIMKFAGDDGRPVEVPCPIQDFLLARAPANAYSTIVSSSPTCSEGLLHAAPASTRGLYILGLNFFQTTHVSLNKDSIRTDTGCSLVPMCRRRRCHKYESTMYTNYILRIPIHVAHLTRIDVNFVTTYHMRSYGALHQESRW
ncbi:hypothetical protein L226DRAFT_279113 [Lentinus tigrinus ALCF2SS1-7]|uniref:uncharacterized protein n=1 Tax=Lentinus tigrinus ALCF2SS1-7 TaxID=1328758 RepID=UPI001165D85C|nr:hypothetical protein L226DRAFT_279113 [Lentinus tigrinus ALCF2SS1-7]